MRDALGRELKVGHLAQVTIGPTGMPIRGHILSVKEGGMMVLTGQKGLPPAQTPDVLIIALEVPLLDAPPGGQHLCVLRLADPAKETIVPVDTKQVS